MKNAEHFSRHALDCKSKLLQWGKKQYGGPPLPAGLVDGDAEMPPLPAGLAGPECRAFHFLERLVAGGVPIAGKGLAASPFPGERRKRKRIVSIAPWRENCFGNFHDTADFQPRIDSGSAVIIWIVPGAPDQAVEAGGSTPPFSARQDRLLADRPPPRRAVRLIGQKSSTASPIPDRAPG